MELELHIETDPVSYALYGAWLGVGASEAVGSGAEEEEWEEEEEEDLDDAEWARVKDQRYYLSP